MSAFPEFTARLDQLPEGVTLPPELQGKLRFDKDGKLLVLTGNLSDEERDKLRDLSKDAAFWKAVEFLYQSSSKPPDGLVWRETDDSRYATEELSVMHRYMPRLLALWFTVLGAVALFMLICFWPPPPALPTETDRRLDTLTQLVTKYVTSGMDIVANDSLNRKSGGHVDSLMKRVEGSSKTPQKSLDSTKAITESVRNGDCPSPEQGLLLIALVAGVLGGSTGGLASLVNFRGNRRLFKSWVLWYFAHPIIAGMISVIFYVAIRAGFFSTASALQNVNVFGIAAFCAMVGLFTDDATTKLSEVFKTFFASTSGEEREGKLNPNEDKSAKKTTA